MLYDAMMFKNRNTHPSFVMDECFIAYFLFLNMPLPGGVFKLELFLPEEYPMAAPKVLGFSFPLSFLCSNVTCGFFHCW